MTVGIAAIAQTDDEHYAIVAADRMVSVGDDDAIEYEAPDTKIEPFVQNRHAAAVVVGSGSTTFIDEVMEQIHVEVAGDQPHTLEGAMEQALAAYQKIVQRTVENQVLSPMGYDLDDLRDRETHIPGEIQRAIAEQAERIRGGVGERVRFLVAGVGDDGAGIYHLSGSDYTNFTQTGYATVGSGSRSARQTFIRRNYDPTSQMKKGLFTVLEAKDQAEERRGVGREMDIAVIEQGSIDTFEGSDIEDLRHRLQRIEDEEQRARENVIDEWER